MHRLAFLAVLVAAIACQGPAVAAGQNGSTPAAASNQPVPEAEAEAPAPDKAAKEPLSDKLDRSGGIIRPPPEVDPGLTHRPAQSGSSSMPVIPPPGTPGGGDEVTPK